MAITLRMTWAANAKATTQAVSSTTWVTAKCRAEAVTTFASGRPKKGETQNRSMETTGEPRGNNFEKALAMKRSADASTAAGAATQKTLYAQGLACRRVAL